MSVTHGNEQPSTVGPTPHVSERRRVWSALRRNKPALAGLFILAVLVLVGIFGPLIAPYGINEVDADNLFHGPSWHHLFGTDDAGRDVFSRVIVAARVSLLVGVVSVSIALLVGVTIGLVSGYYRGVVDNVLMRCMDVLFAFPVLLLAVAIVAVLGRGLATAMVAIGVVYTPIFARVTRASVLSVREQVFVQAAVATGAGDARIMRRHVLPNIAAPLIVQTSLSLAFAILSEAALSFLGLGVQPPDPSWGRMLYEARGFVQDAWWMGLFPGLAIFLVVLAFNIVGDALRDVLDPRQLTLTETQRRGA